MRSAVQLEAPCSTSGRALAPAASWRHAEASWRPQLKRQQQQQRRRPAAGVRVRAAEQQHSAEAAPGSGGSSAATTVLHAAEAAAGREAADAAAAQVQALVAELASAQASRPAVDHYKAAGQRLRSLLSGVGDGEEELLNSMLEEQPPAQKLALCLGASALICGGAAAVCWLCDIDPFGGASLSVDSLRAFAIGGAAAAPLAGAKALLWSEWARRQLPFLEDINRAQVDAFRPMLSNLSPAQTLVLLFSEVIPSMFILLPACTGGIAKSLQMYGSMADVDLPAFLPGVLALCITSAIAGVGKVAETSVTMEEYEVVKDALGNADRYYKLMAPAGPGSSPLDAARAADAFKAVALTWIARNQVATRFAAALGALEVMFLGGLWQQTGDLAAPMAAALAAAAVDFSHMRRLSAPAKPGGTA